MRIIAGANRGTRLTALGKGDSAAHLRPTPDRVREALFSVIGARIEWEDLRVLDLFAGSGALGLEAMSRGAAQVTFVENGRTGQKLVSANIALLRCAARCRLVKQDVARLGPADAPCDLVFLDPPYGKGLGQIALDRAVAQGWLAAHALIVWEESAPQDAPAGFDLIQHRKYGDTHLTLLDYVGA